MRRRQIGVEELRDSISNVLGFQRVTNLGTYLGVPLFHERVTNSSLKFVVDKVRAKLQCWNVKQLSMAGKSYTCSVNLAFDP
ncbi:Retrovirus-related Pol polyprotein LINE-1 [Gossypium australe]|uniref:Retrovirus-related Pol polyprotein LINE-1 n=1 Tax=Gossypium australe TaxID=47621 RepID=A0A5B6VIW8_9ROSI|nr:Retrovirus-related Pol polyprotein LINE-1 [Gossypium australe]